MRQSPTMRKTAYIVLCASPAVIAALDARRAFRIPVFSNVAGLLVFGIVAACAIMVSAPPRTPPLRDARLRVAAALMLAPFALIGLFFVGLGTPFESTASENVMRYSVVLTAAIAITTGFIFLKDALAAVGETLYSTAGFAFALMSGMAYVVWNSFQLGYWIMRVALHTQPEAMATMNNVMDALLFAASALAYAGTATFARALSAAGWLGRRSSIVYVALNLVALALLVVRGVTFPVPGAGSEPWYTQPGFVVGIPAMPWLLPFFLGAVVLHRFGKNTPGVVPPRAG